MNARTLGYWIPTALFALAMTGSGVFNASRAEPIVQGMAHLGFPAWLPLLLGIWKLLGVVAILVPGFPRLKEWAYAGFFFNLSGAFVSHLAAGDAVGDAIAPLVILGIGLASWAMRPEGRRLGTIIPAGV